jgi:hypothetical protein
MGTGKGKMTEVMSCDYNELGWGEGKEKITEVMACDNELLEGQGARRQN